MLYSPNLGNKYPVLLYYIVYYNIVQPREYTLRSLKGVDHPLAIDSSDIYE